MVHNLYVNRNTKEWQRFCEEEYNNITECVCHTLKRGYILPLKATEENGSVFCGGVCNEQGEFVAGLLRKFYNYKMTYSCCKAYEVLEDDLEYCDEEVIFGGILIPLFGHCMTETMSRLWYLMEEQSDRKIIFLNIDNRVPDYFREFLELLGIAWERIVFLDKPTRFRTVLVPEQALVLHGGYHPKLAVVYDKMIENAVKKESGVGKKVYFSRTANPRGDCFNEEYFEEFYREQGYVIVYPEKESIAKKIAIVQEADEIVAVLGTTTHYSLFAREKTKLVCLLRENDPLASRPQLLIDQIRDMNCSIVDISCNILPTNFSVGVYLLGPTKNFEEYVIDSGMYFMSEESKRMKWEKLLYPYILKWSELCSTYPRLYYKYIVKNDMFDIVNRMSIMLHDKPLNREDFPSVPKDGTLYVPRDVRLVDAAAHEAKQLHFEKVYLKQGEKGRKNTSAVVEAMKKFQKTEESYDLIQLNDEEHCFCFDDETLKRVFYSTIEVVFLEYSRKPGSLQARYTKKYGQRSWDIMVQILKQKYPDYYKESQWIFANNILYQYNAITMKKRVFMELSTWLLPLLEEIGECLEREEQFLLDSLAEILITLYFQAQIKKYVWALSEDNSY